MIETTMMRQAYIAQISGGPSTARAVLAKDMSTPAEGERGLGYEGDDSGGAWTATVFNLFPPHPQQYIKLFFCRTSSISEGGAHWRRGIFTCAESKL